MHLWRRPSGWTFQKRVPADLVNRLGTSPIRLCLPPLQAREARRQAILLAGVAEQNFSRLRRTGMPDGTEPRDPRDELIAELRRQLEQQNGMLVETRDALHASLKSAESHAATSVELVKAISDLRAELARQQSQTKQKELPLLSAELPNYLEAKRKALDPDGEGNDQLKYTIPAAFAAFIEIMGDKALHDYVTNDLERFGVILARVPANKTKLRMLREMTYVDAADFNAKLKKRYKTLTETTIERSYLSPVKAGLAWMFGEHNLISPFVAVAAKAPPQARPGGRRDSLTNEEVNKVLQVAAEQARPEDRWLPLLAFLTGARLFELVQMQGRNIQRVGGHWIYDLRKEVVRKDGKIRKARVKNVDSERPIVLHQILVDLGFIEWAKSRTGYIFDKLHRAKSPKRAASKRMIRLLKKAKVKADNKVFHSKRHSTKDWLRDNKVHDRDINLQVGHAMASVAEEYGKNTLRPDDFDQFAIMVLPKELDLSRYRERAKVEQENAKRRKASDRAHD